MNEKYLSSTLQCSHSRATNKSNEIKGSIYSQKKRSIPNPNYENGRGPRLFDLISYRYPLKYTNFELFNNQKRIQYFDRI